MNIDNSILDKLTLGLIAIAFVIVIFNSIQLSSLIGQSTQPITVNVLSGSSGSVSLSDSGSTSTGQVSLSSGDNIDILPVGVPAIYGAELGISFDSVSASDPQSANATISLLGDLDRSLELEGADLERYINVLYTLENGISCEYCCGARSIIFDTGKSACGCAHSYAMRGLTKYLILNHGDEFTDAELLAENGKWKVLFFPTQSAVKAQVLQDQGIEVNMINLTSNKYRDIEKQSAGGSSGGMVGGC